MSHAQEDEVRSPRKLIDVNTAAAHAAVSTRTIRRWIADGRLRGYRTGPKLVRVDKDDLDRTIRPIPAAGSGGNAA
jgi:excisionase family DNA binding protein